MIFNAELILKLCLAFQRLFIVIGIMIVLMVEKMVEKEIRNLTRMIDHIVVKF